MYKKQRTITLWGNKYRIHKVEKNTWCFIDIPFCCMFGKDLGKDVNYKTSYIKTIVENVIKPELEKALSKKVKSISIPKKEQIKKWYKSNKERVKYHNGESRCYWTSTPYNSDNSNVDLVWVYTNFGSTNYYYAHDIAYGIVPVFTIEK